MGRFNKIGEKSYIVALILFIFQMINREFVPIIDLRIIIIFLALISIFLNINKRSKISDSFPRLLILLFLSWGLVSIFFVSKLPFFTLEVWNTHSVNLIILYAYLIVVSLATFINSRQVSFKIVYRTIFFAMLFNFIFSMYLYFKLNGEGTDLGVLLPLTEIKGYVIGDMHSNFLGNHFRIAGYSEDANYLSFNSAILILLSIMSYSKKNQILPLFGIVLGTILFAISGSKTVLIAFICVFMYYIYCKKIKELDLTILFIFLSIATIIIAILPQWLNLGDSLNNRFLLWNRGLNLFTQYPIVGSGVSGFRHFGTEIDWVVHSHSTFIQVLSEQGIVGLVLLTIVFTNSVNIIRIKEFRLLLFLYLITSITFDLSYTEYFVFFLVVLPIVSKERIFNDNNKKKIVMLSNGLSNGGAERMAYDLCVGLSEKVDYEVTLLLTDPDDPQNSLSNMYDKKNVHFNIIQVSDKKHDVLKNNFRIYKIIQEIQPNFVHTHQITLIYCLLSFLLGNDFIKFHTVHNDSHKEFGSKIFRQFYHFLFIIFRINLISISQYIMKTSTEEYRLLPRRYHSLIYNGRTTSLKENTVRDDNKFKIIMVGRLTDVKNHNAAIEMMNIICNDKHMKNIYLEIYGEGPLKNELDKKIIELELSDNVFLKGITSEITEKMQNSDIFLMTSRHEGFPLSAIEAMTAKLPMILSNFGSAKELIENNGFIVEVDDYNKYAEIIIRLESDKKTLKTLSKNSADLSERFALNKMIDKYYLLFESKEKEIL